MKLGAIGFIMVMACGAFLCYMVERSHVKDKGATTCISTPAGDVCGQASATSDLGDKAKEESDKLADKAKKLTK